MVVGVGLTVILLARICARAGGNSGPYRDPFDRAATYPLTDAEDDT